MTVEIISVGTELLLGNIVNTNAAYLAEKCAMLGLSCFYQSVVGDNEKRLEESVTQAISRSDIVLLGGGLGPTKDDITKEVAAGVFGMALLPDPHTEKRMREYFTRSGRGMPTENNWKQALVPEGAKVIDNDNGTAPGLILEKDGRRAILLPGPPNELKPMFEKSVTPYLRNLQTGGIFSKMVKVCGIGESKAETMISNLMAQQDDLTIAPYAKTGEVHFRVTARADREETAEALMKPVIEEMYRIFGSHIYTLEDKDTLEMVLIRTLREKKLVLTTAESCTAGLLAGRIVNVPGASACYEEGYITYSDQAKIKCLNVRESTLKGRGAVSEDTAYEMAEGALKASGADIALSVTGIAGPEGGTTDKPVGLTYIGCSLRGKTVVEKHVFSGSRQKNREYAVARALILLRKMLEGSSSREESDRV